LVFILAPLYGPEIETAQEVQEAARVKHIVDSPQDFFDLVDVMMVTCRKGSEHMKYALPFAKAGMPLFIDKPFTASPEEAKELIRVAKENHSIITGGSGCKYAWDVQTLALIREKMQSEGNLLSASMNFAADTDSPYDGFYFYASHLTEMALTVFGSEVSSVTAFESKGGVVSIWHYEDYDMTLHYTRNSQDAAAVLYGKTSNVLRPINIDMIYGLEVERFVQMLRTGQMPYTYEELIQPVIMIDAILESLNSRKSVSIKK
jgi:predicted dehydrogenase